ncbi:MAG: thiamine phosphate synthase [Bacteroidales bacterium]|nr:thiamine phosphate synthase [Bacteroidales bacterium]MDD4209913.1 thiamine phosphate synthase [Bacteroidales bacterium]
MKRKCLKDYRLQFITHCTESYDYYESAKIALEGGIRWIQLRMKEAGEDEIKKEAMRIKNVCQMYEALFIIDDYVELAIELEADGVHLGQNDMPIKEARRLAGTKLIIGGTANTFSQLKVLSDEGVDYIGLGPLRFTQTKHTLAPILGLKGIKEIIDECKYHHVDLPIYVIGGVQKEDVITILQTGATGIALSSAILQTKHPLNETKEFMQLTNKRK